MECWKEAERRVDRIRIAVRSPNKRAKFARMLNIPKVVWSGWKKFPDACLKNLRLTIERTFRAGGGPKSATGPRSKYLAWTCLTHRCYPFFQAALAVIRTHTWRIMNAWEGSYHQLTASVNPMKMFVKNGGGKRHRKAGSSRKMEY